MKTASVGEGLDVDQSTMAGGRCDSIIDVLGMFAYPLDNLHGMVDSIHTEDRCTGHHVIEYLHPRTACRRYDGHTSGDGCYKRTLGGGHGNKERTFGIIAFDKDRTGECQRYLRYTDHVLDVLGCTFRIE